MNRYTDIKRGNFADRGYGSQHRNRFRVGVLSRDPWCVLCGVAPATVADHYPLSRRQLVEVGADADNPENGRGLCAQCHNKETAKHQPGHRFRRGDQ